jgi:hypothetical protein
MGAAGVGQLRHSMAKARLAGTRLSPTASFPYAQPGRLEGLARGFCRRWIDRKEGTEHRYCVLHISGFTVTSAHPCDDDDGLSHLRLL